MPYRMSVQTHNPVSATMRFDVSIRLTYGSDRAKVRPTSMRTSARAHAAVVVLSFILVALVQAWPLPLHLRTQLTGDPGSDLGV